MAWVAEMMCGTLREPRYSVAVESPDHAFSAWEDLERKARPRHTSINNQMAGARPKSSPTKIPSDPQKGFYKEALFTPFYNLSQLVKKLYLGHLL